MYARLLEAVLTDEDDPSASVATRSSGPLAELVRLRHAMDKHAERSDPGWALQAVTDQLAYDAALVQLARRRGVPVDLGCFDVPDRGRSQLEQALVAKGVNLPARATPDEGAAGGTADRTS
jgi:hypothetical protein